MSARSAVMGDRVVDSTRSNRSKRDERIPVIEAESVSFSAPGVPIVADISLSVAPGEFLAIVGPSGCGKTTFLNLIAGLGRPSTGTLLVHGAEPVPSPAVAMYAFARDALLPWRTAAQNISLPLEILGVPKGERRTRVEELLSRVGLQDAGNRYRAELSQGMRQRVALARSLAPKPELLVMDEPFAALDAQTRVAMQRVLLDVLAAENTTVVFVTHDLAEAITLADRVALFSKRPCAMRELMPIPLSKPRHSAQLRTDPAFHKVYDRLWEILRREVAGLNDEEEGSP